MNEPSHRQVPRNPGGMQERRLQPDPSLASPLCRMCLGRAGLDSGVEVVLLERPARKKEGEDQSMVSAAVHSHPDIEP